MTAHQGLVLHVQVGNGSCYGEFSDPNNQASSTWWVSKGGVLEQYVDSDEAAWTEAQGNFTWDSVETEGDPSEALTTAQVNMLARLYAWGVQTYKWPLALAETPASTGFGWHGMGGAAWGGHLGCPGDLRKAQRQLILNLATQILNPFPLNPGADMDDPTFTRWCYYEFFLRDPDPGGFAAWVAFLAGGGHRNDMMATFIDAPEGKTVLAARRKALAI
jgi:hypothetical protein